MNLQETHHIHLKVNSRDLSISKNSVTDSSPYRSPHPKDGGSVSNRQGAPSIPSLYPEASGRKDSPDVQPSCPSLKEQQKSPASQSHTLRLSLTSTKIRMSHTVSKSRFSDSKGRKTCSQQSPLTHSKASKPEKEQEDVKTESKQKDKALKKERKNNDKKAYRKDEERKRRRREEKRSGEKKKKRVKELKEDRKLKGKFKKAKKERVSSLFQGEAKFNKVETSSSSPESQSQSSLKHKRREKTSVSPSTECPGSTSQHSTIKLVKKPKSKCSPSQLSVKKQPTKSLSNYPKQTSNTSSPSENGPKTPLNGTFPSVVCKASALLSTACSVSLEQAIHNKDDGQGGILSAPDLQPEAMLGNLTDGGDNHANTPPVLSWQGSPVSDFEEEERELEKGVMSRPVLQPSPTQCFSPHPADSESNYYGEKELSLDKLNEKPCNNTSDFCEPSCPIKPDIEKDKEDQVNTSGKTSVSLLNRFHQHKAGLDDVFKSLANFLGSQRATCRGGPFGGASTKGVKYSSSLAMVPQIHDCENQDISSKLNHTLSSESNNPESHSDTTSNSLVEFHTSPYLKEPVKMQEKIESSAKESKEGRLAGNLLEKSESSLLEESLSAELRVTTTHRASFTSVISVSTKEKRENRKETGLMAASRKRKQKAEDVGRGAEVKKKKKIKMGKVKNKANQGKVLNKRGISSSVSVVSRPPAGNMKGQIPQENQLPHGKDIKRVKLDTGNSDANMVTDIKVEDSELENKVTSYNTTLNSAATITTIKSGTTKPARSPPCSKAPVDPLRLKALSMGLSKELKIILVKMDSAGRQTFNISELEERRIPLSKINIQNTAIEVIRACK